MAKFLDKNGVQYLWQKIKGAFAPLSHTHVMSQITDLFATGVKSGEKVISVDNSGKLQSTLSIAYDSNSQKMQLKGISNEVISEFDASVFVKDAFLNAASLVVVSASQAGTTGYPAAAGTYLKFEWNLAQSAGGVDVTWVDVTTLIDIYTAGNGIDITSGAVSVKVDNTTAPSTDMTAVTLTAGANGLRAEVDLTGKVDKVEGKQLSTEDYTTAEKTKLANIAAGATADEALSYGSASADIDTAIAAAETAGAIAPGEYAPAAGE